MSDDMNDAMAYALNAQKQFEAQKRRMDRVRQQLNAMQPEPSVAPGTLTVSWDMSEDADRRRLLLLVEA